MIAIKGKRTIHLYVMIFYPPGFSPYN